MQYAWMEEGWLVGRHRDERFCCSFRFLATSRASSSSLTFYQHSALVSTRMLGIPLDLNVRVFQRTIDCDCPRKVGATMLQSIRTVFSSVMCPLFLHTKYNLNRARKISPDRIASRLLYSVLSKLSLRAYGASLSPSTLRSIDVLAIATIYVQGGW